MPPAEESLATPPPRAVAELAAEISWDKAVAETHPDDFSLKGGDGALAAEAYSARRNEEAASQLSAAAKEGGAAPGCCRCFMKARIGEDGGTVLGWAPPRCTE